MGLLNCAEVPTPFKNPQEVEPAKVDTALEETSTTRMLQLTQSARYNNPLSHNKPAGVANLARVPVPSFEP